MTQVELAELIARLRENAKYLRDWTEFKRSADTMELAADALEARIPQEDELRELRDMRNVILSATRDVTVGHLLDLFGWQSVAALEGRSGDVG